MPNDGKPLVSVCCLAYNHAPYIRDCLEGFVMQRTDFPFEVLIHDDASTDGTADIIREYEAKYPEIIKPIYQSENQYSRGVNVGFKTLDLVQGKYIAFCEGDDFWCDPLKLQKQVECFRRFDNVGLVFHRVRVVRGNKVKHNVIMFDGLPWHKDFWKDICEGRAFLHTSSAMILASTLKYREGLPHLPTGDTAVFLWGCLENSAVFINEEMSVYRICQQSATHHKTLAQKWKYLSSLIKANPDLIQWVRRYKPEFSAKTSVRHVFIFWGTMLKCGDESCRDDVLNFLRTNGFKIPCSIRFLEWMRRHGLAGLRMQVFQIILKITNIPLWIRAFYGKWSRYLAPHIQYYRTSL